MRFKTRPDGQDFTSIRPAYKDHFSGETRDPAAWIRSADALIEAAECLRPAVEEHWRRVQEAIEGGEPTSWPIKGPRIIPVHTMLMGFAAENLLKAIAVRRWAAKLPADLEKLPEELANHGLWALAQKLDLDLTPREAQLLWRLGDYAMWSGRYPMPVALGSFEPQAQVSTDFSSGMELLAKLRSEACGLEAGK
jgi:hypothetical protein